MANTLELLNSVNIQFLLNPPIFEAVQTATPTSIPTGTGWTPITFVDAGGILLDPYNGHSTVTNPSRWVAPTPGWYFISGVAAYSSNSTGERGAIIAKNGTTYQGSGELMPPNTAGATAVSTPTRKVHMNGTTDYLELYGRQGSGGSLNTAIFSDLTCALSISFAHL